MITETTNSIASSLYQVVTITTCPTLSGRSQLTYHIGCIGTEIQIRIVANTAAGYFNDEWIPFSTIQQKFDTVPAGLHITSFLLHEMFQGKSVNTPAFLFAVLKNEGLVQQAKEKQRQYERVDPAAFVARIRELIAAGINLKWEEPVKASKKLDAKVAKVEARPTKTGGKKSSPAAAENGEAEKTSAVVPMVNHSESSAAKLDDIPRFTDVTPSAIEPKAAPAIAPKKSKAKGKP